MKRIFTLVVMLCTIGFVDYTFAQEVKINHTGTGVSASGLVVETDGTIRMDGAATVWDDIMVPGFSTKNKLNPPLLETFLDNVLINYFEDVAANSENQVYFTVQFPHSWKGTAIKPHIHWSPDSNPGGDKVVRWGLEYTWVEYNSTTPETFPASTTIYVNGACATGSQKKHLLASFSDITPLASQDGISSMMVCRLFRNSSHADDTYLNKAAFLQFDIHFEKDTEGSRDDLTK